MQLKLKAKAKGGTETVGLGIGYDNGMLWNSDVNAMYFDKQRQHVSIMAMTIQGKEPIARHNTMENTMEVVDSEHLH